MPSALSALPTSERFVAGQHEGQHAGLLLGGADQSHPGNVGQQRSGVLQQCVLVGRDPLDADLLDVAQRLAEPDGVGDVAGAGLELVRQPLVQRAFQGDVGDHVAAALPGRGLRERFLGAVEHADSGGAEDLVPGEHEEVRAERLHVDRDVRDRLGAVDEHPGAVAVAEFDDLRRTGVTVPSALETWVAATSLVRGPSRSSNSLSSRLPASSTGATFRTAPVCCESSCHGTMLAWCSRWVMTISSPGPRCLPPQA